ncbi:hypothetical protein AWC38_SpisGene14525 [Stylophora pistillata]|uniref:Apple domain-containing protein n=1 Tax=Stylophora pistillata TaxID=50429 RepID=A0A2B4RTR6_STYPI|nr:hypothetical protein AWC38_SpisGene14525 [Stylophora pistillata]
MMRQKHIFKKITGAAFGDVCLRECYRDIRCQSLNYVFTQDKSELSNRTKEARPADSIPNSERYYFRRDMGRDSTKFLRCLLFTDGRSQLQQESALRNPSEGAHLGQISDYEIRAPPMLSS